MLTCLLACTLGFMPALGQAIGLIVVLALLLVLLSTNLVLPALLGAATKLVALFFVPVSFYVGRAFLDGPAQGLFRALINAPITAYFALEYYTTTGGLFLGLAFGAVVGLLVNKAIRAFRQRLVHLEALKKLEDQVPNEVGGDLKEKGKDLFNRFPKGKSKDKDKE